LIEINGTSKKPVVLMTVALCFIISLSIEIFQA